MNPLPRPPAESALRAFARVASGRRLAVAVRVLLIVADGSGELGVCRIAPSIPAAAIWSSHVQR